VTRLAPLDAILRPSVPAERLAALRILVGAFGAIYLTVRAPSLASVAHLPASSFAPIGVVSVLDAPLPAAGVWALAIAAVALGWAFALGVAWRIVGPVFAVVLLWVTSYRSSFGMIFHTENLWVVHVALLATAPAADAWSIDARRCGRAPADPAPRYGFAIVAMSVVTALAYLLAGVAKLRTAGLDWVTSDALRNYVAYDNLRKILLGDVHAPLGGALVRHPELFKPLAALSMGFELLAPAALLGRRPATVVAIGLWSFHVGVLATMAILFPYPLLGIAFAPWFPVERPLRALVDRLARRATARA
jgi:hypothetical protein